MSGYLTAHLDIDGAAACGTKTRDGGELWLVTDPLNVECRKCRAIVKSMKKAS